MDKRRNECALTKEDPFKSSLKGVIGSVLRDIKEQQRRSNNPNLSVNFKFLFAKYEAPQCGFINKVDRKNIEKPSKRQKRCSIPYKPGAASGLSFAEKSEIDELLSAKNMHVLRDLLPLPWNFQQNHCLNQEFQQLMREI